MSKKFNIIVIEPNSFTTKDLKKGKNNSIHSNKLNYSKISGIDINKFKNDTKSFIKIMNVENNPADGPSNERYTNKLFNEVKIREAEILCRVLNDKTDNLVTQCQFDCTNVLETDEYLFQMCYVSFFSVGSEETRKKVWSQLPPINRFASLLNYDGKAVFGNAIILCNKLPLDNYDIINSDVTMEDLLQILQSKSVHYGVLLKSNGVLEQIEYKNDENFLKKKESNTKLYNFNLSLYSNENSEGELNNLAKKLLYEDIRGDVYVIGKYQLEDHPEYYHYDDLSVENVKKMITIAPENQKDLTLKKDEIETTRDKLNRSIIKSRFRILDKRYRNYS